MMEIFHCYFDSDEFQFIASEQFKLDISSNAINSYKYNFNQSIFNKSDIKHYKKLARSFNREGLGDQAVFFIKPKTSSDK